jgi:hypothetical protein
MENHRGDCDYHAGGGGVGASGGQVGDMATYKDGEHPTVMIPPGTVVTINGMPFELVESALVYGCEGNLDLALNELHKPKMIDCECHYQEPYGWVVMAGCKWHD